LLFQLPQNNSENYTVLSYSRKSVTCHLAASWKFFFIHYAFYSLARLTSCASLLCDMKFRLLLGSWEVLCPMNSISQPLLGKHSCSSVNHVVMQAVWRAVPYPSVQSVAMAFCSGALG